MDFFKSVFSTDPEPYDPANDSDSPRHEEDDQDQQQEEQEEGSPPANPNTSPPSSASGSGAWGLRLGGLIKTIASRSESVIETYRRDLEEFSTGLKKETSVFKEVASRAVRDLPVSLEAGASVAQESLETVGQAIDDFGGSVWRGTADIISHGKDALLSIDNNNDSSFSQDPASSSEAAANSQTSKRYSRFEAQVLAIQSDANTFVEEPEDGKDFEKWRAGFRMEEKEEEIEGMLYDNGTLEGFFERFVPDVVDRETFWGRYFYRVYRLKQAEDARAKLVKRVIAGEEEEELSWEVDDSDENEEEVMEEEEDEKEEGGTVAEREIVVIEEKKPIEEAVESSEKSEEEAKGEVAQTSEKPKEEVVKEEVVESTESVEEKKPVEASQVQNVEEEEKVKSSGMNDLSSKTEDKFTSDAKPEPAESGKDSDFSVISSQPSMPEEDDLGWDEIEDLGEHEDKKVVGTSGSPKKVDLRKRLSVAEDDEDLSWDIEDGDDEPAKP